jgi:hypothetical protein
MMSLLINIALALLLVTCIVYCLRLEKRLRIFQSANAVLGESVTLLARQTKDAEDAILRFKETAAQCEAQLAVPLSAARTLSGKLEEQIDDAETVMNKIGRIVSAAGPAPAPLSPVTPVQSSSRRRASDGPERASRSRFAGIG